MSELGNWYALATLIAGFTMHFSGSLIDHHSNQKMAILVLLGILSGGILMALAPNGINLLLIYFLLRFLGQGMATHIAYTSVSRENHPKRGVAISLIATAMPIGEAVLPISSVILLSVFGWQTFWLLLTVCAGLLIIGGILISPKNNRRLSKSEEANQQPNDSSPQSMGFTRKQALKTGQFWALVIAILFPAFAVTALFFHQQLWLLDKQLSLQQFASALSLYAVTHVLGSLFSGWLVDRIGLTRMLKKYMIPMALSVLSLLLLSSEVSLYSFMFLAGITVGASGPVTGSLWPTLYGSKHLGAIRGTITALMVISTAIAPALFGWLKDSGWNSQHLLSLLSVYGISAVFILQMVKIHPLTVAK